MEELVDSRLALEEERDRRLSYEVAHPLVQETIYLAISKVRRRGLHRRIARALLAGDRLGEAAAHFARSGEVGDSEAIDALQEALRQAEDQGSYREGLTILGALAALLPPGDPRWIRILDALSWTPEWVVDHRGDAGDVIGAGAMRAIDAALQCSPDAGRRAKAKAKYHLATALRTPHRPNPRRRSIGAPAGRGLRSTAGQRLLEDSADEDAAEDLGQPLKDSAGIGAAKNLMTYGFDRGSMQRQD